MKKCVHCKELIDDKATKCKFCGSDLRNWFFRHKILTVILILFVLLVSFISSITSKAPTSRNISPYEVVSEGGASDSHNMNIYTAEKNPAELIKINDKLIADNSQYLYLFIRYFDDKIIAKDYFTKLADESISEKEKDRLFTHYTADYKSTVNKLNINKDGEWVEIKSY